MKIDFAFETEYGKFSDSLNFSDDVTLPSDAEIENIKRQRLNDWLLIVTPKSVDKPMNLMEQMGQFFKPE